jgi:microcystin-dependent protein
MPVPSSFNDISETPSSNSPLGSEPVGPNANDYLQAAFAFIRQIYDGAVKPLAAVDFNAEKLTNIAAGTISTTSNDAVRGDQIYRVGEVRYWYGPPTEAAVVGAWPVGWHFADGTHGTPDLRDRFLVGAGLSYPNAATGGAATVSLSTAQLPSHSHGISDTGHVHGIIDSGHAHGVTDPGHNHGSGNGGGFITNTGSGGPVISSGSGGGVSGGTSIAVTGIGVNSSGSNISMASATTGISGTQNTGSGAAIENRPPYFALVPIYYTGAA